MDFRRAFKSILALLFAAAHLVLAGPGGHIALINATPFNWTLTYSHSYQMDWKPALTIPSGVSSAMYAEFQYQWGDDGDCAAEALYTLVGSPNPASFTLQARQKKGKRFQIQYHETLSSLNNPEGSLIDLGYQHDGTVPFVLAGDGYQPYVGSNPPIAWMQATLSTIGTKTLREIALPASHDSGMSELTRHYGGIDHNTKTQTYHVYEQLKYGARSFDIRPVYRKGKWYTGHFTAFKSTQFGAFGRSIPDVISDINRFNVEYPGELIILEVSHELDCGKKWRETLSDMQWESLYKLFEDGIQHPWISASPSLPSDLTQVPLNQFIQPGSNSTVLIHLPGSAPNPADLRQSTPTRRNQELSHQTKASQQTQQHTPHPHLLGLPADGDDSGLLPPQPNINTTHPQNSSILISPLPNPNTPPPPPTPVPFLKPYLLIPSPQLPHYGSYSNTQSPLYLSTSQLRELIYYRDNPPSSQPPLRSTWTITQQIPNVFDIFNDQGSIIGQSKIAKKAFFGFGVGEGEWGLWNGMRERGRWVNWVEIDDVRMDGVLGWCLGVNFWFLGGWNPMGGVREEFRGNLEVWDGVV